MFLRITLVFVERFLKNSDEKISTKKFQFNGVGPVQLTSILWPKGFFKYFFYFGQKFILSYFYLKIEKNRLKKIFPFL